MESLFVLFKNSFNSIAIRTLNSFDKFFNYNELYKNYHDYPFFIEFFVVNIFLNFYCLKKVSFIFYFDPFNVTFIHILL